MLEIERKFAVKRLPDLTGISEIKYERYFLSIDEGLGDRIQKKGDRYEREIKRALSDLTRTVVCTEISQIEFERLKQVSFKSIIRSGYMLSHNPDLSIKIYHGEHEGLMRTEIEFSSVDEARKYIPEDWMGTEITESPIG